MARGKFIAALAGLFALSLNFAAARAATIDYTFIGTGTGTLGKSTFSGTFDVNLVGNTTSVFNLGNFFSNAGTATFASGGLNATLNSGSQVILINGPSGFANVGFAQLQPPPVFAVNEAVFNNAFLGYALASAFPLTGGTVSFLPQTYLTNLGALSFSSISSLKFEAGMSATPLPASWTMMLGVLVVGFGFAFYQRAKRDNGAVMSAAA
jgi:hypothetical protein